jgi:hypothetical protein
MAESPTLSLSCTHSPFFFQYLREGEGALLQYEWTSTFQKRQDEILFITWIYKPIEAEMLLSRVKITHPPTKGYADLMTSKK